MLNSNFFALLCIAMASASLVVETPLLTEFQGRHFLRFGITGTSEHASSTPMHLVFLVDESGSMQGNRIDLAKHAAREAIKAMRPNDFVSVVAFQSEARVLLPAMRIDENSRARALSAVSSIQAGGGTNLFDGLREALNQAKSSETPSRIVLLSDGEANQGPVSKEAFKNLLLSMPGPQLTTVGLHDSYNEDLMVFLARSTDGNHIFCSSEEALAKTFLKEVQQASNVVAQSIKIDIPTHDGFADLRLLGDLFGTKFSGLSIPTLAAGEHRAFIFELSRKTSMVPKVDVRVTWETTSGLQSHLMTAETATPEDERSIAIDVVKKQAVEESHKAMLSRDAGKHEEAQNILATSTAQVRQQAIQYGSAELVEVADEAHAQAENMIKTDWKTARKQMHADNYNRGYKYN